MVGVVIYTKHLYNTYYLPLDQIITFFLYLALLSSNLLHLSSKKDNSPSKLALMRLFVAIKQQPITAEKEEVELE